MLTTLLNEKCIVDNKTCFNVYLEPLEMSSASGHYSSQDNSGAREGQSTGREFAGSKLVYRTHTLPLKVGKFR